MNRASKSIGIVPNFALYGSVARPTWIDLVHYDRIPLRSRGTLRPASMMRDPGALRHNRKRRDFHRRRDLDGQTALPHRRADPFGAWIPVFADIDGHVITTA
jgi:hypothetical protein